MWPAGAGTTSTTTSTMKSIYTPEYRFMLTRLRAAREDAGRTQGQVAAHFGRPQSFVSKHGERRASDREALRAAPCLLP
jgi:hypothetical protein